MDEIGAAIGIICKAPRAGASKTRLIPILGPDQAAQASGCFLRDLAATIRSLPPAMAARGFMVFAPADAEAELRRLMPPEFGAMCQHHAGLGAVLSHASAGLLAQGHDCVLLVNGDSPTLPASLLAEAIAALRQPGERVVFGPAIDGGYYLIGLKQAHPSLFADIDWSTPQVLAQSLQRAAAIGLPAVLLPTWYDVDDGADLDWLLAEIGGQSLPFLDRPGSPATATRALLAGIFPRPGVCRHTAVCQTP